MSMMCPFTQQYPQTHAGVLEGDVSVDSAGAASAMLAAASKAMMNKWRMDFMSDGAVYLGR